MKIKRGSAAIAAWILILAFLSAFYILLSFSLPPAIFEILDRYLYIRYDKQTNMQVLTNPATVQTMQSGPVSEVPWENDLAFLSASEKYHAPVLMAAYKTVMIDPKPGEKANVHLAAQMLAGNVVMPGQVFSQNACLGPYVKEKGYKKGPSLSGDNLIETYGGGVCKIASTLYNAAVLSNLAVIERHCHSKPVPYVPYGQDATVSYGMFDFKFKNNTDFPVLIWAKAVHNVLFIAFYGSEEPPAVEWRHEFLRIFKAPNLYKNNSNLKEGAKKMAEEGMDGAIVESHIIIRYKDKKCETKRMGKSYYDAYPYIYEKKLY